MKCHSRLCFTAVNQEARTTEFEALHLLEFDLCSGAARGGKHPAAILFT
jgi:hypothetical protein